MADRLKVGMAGVGGFGRTRRQLMRETGLFEIVAAYDISEEALACCRDEDGASPASSYEALLDTPGIEAVIISTGGKFHAEQAVAAAEKGLHVFIEKPLASTPDEVRAIIGAGSRHGVVMGCGHEDHRGNPVDREIKRLIESGEIGKVAAFEATTSHGGGFLIKPGDWRGDPATNPGGMLFQCGVHKLHELIYYFGPVRRIRAVMRYDIHTTQTADVAFCHVEFDSGLVGTLNAYHVAPCEHRLAIYGTRTAIRKDKRPWGFAGVWVRSIPEGYTGAAELESALEVAGEPDPAGDVRSFYKAVREGGVPYPSALDGACAVAPVFAAEESARTGGAWIDVERFS
jgi:UDP-N-acetyl-2-amino-2-deoxyglucuronate dehydrogenase